jgi:hypothetical protein
MNQIDCTAEKSAIGRWAARADSPTVGEHGLDPSAGTLRARAAPCACGACVSASDGASLIAGAPKK